MKKRENTWSTTFHIIINCTYNNTSFVNNSKKIVTYLFHNLIKYAIQGCPPRIYSSLAWIESIFNRWRDFISEIG